MNYQEPEEDLNYANKHYICSLDLAMDIIGSKWKPKAIYHLKDGVMRSRELEKSLRDISNKMFVQTMRELVKDDLVERIVYPEVPPRVEYKLRPRGEALMPFLRDLMSWGRAIAQENK